MVQKGWKSRKSIASLLTVQFLFSASVFLDIPIARQVIGFAFLMFIPGLILLRILKLNKLDLVERILLSVGLSIAFLMFGGLIINELFPLIGVSKPLSLMPLMITLNIVIFLSHFFSCSTTDQKFSVSVAKYIKRVRLAALLFILLPLLSIIGVVAVNALGNNFVLLIMILMISVLILVTTISDKIVPSTLYPLALFAIAVALLFHYSLISNYIIGNDIQIEYLLFKLTEDNSRWISNLNWNPTLSLELSKMNAMLSITVFPSIFSIILDMDTTWVLKIIYPLIFSLVPLGLCQIYTNKFGKKVAFLSAFFFLAYPTFFNEMLGLARQMVAEFFFVLLFLVLFNERISSSGKTLFFLVFGAGLVVSHYAMSYVFEFLVLFTWILLFLMKIRGKKIKTSLVLLVFVMMFSWYIYVSRSGAFEGFLMFANNVYSTLSSFFILQSRGEFVLRGLGMEAAPSFVSFVGRSLFYVTEFFVFVGFIVLMSKPMNPQVNTEYKALTSLSFVLLAMTIVLPSFAGWFNMTRFYHVLLFFLAPLCIVGGRAFFKLVLKLKSESRILALICIIIVSSFLFQTSFIYEITGDRSWSVPLSKYRFDIEVYVDAGIVDEQGVLGAQWLSSNLNNGHMQIYADLFSLYHELISYGMINSTQVLSNTTKVHDNMAVYLDRVNTIHGIIVGKGEIWNTTEIQASLINDMNKIYSNGESEIYAN